ncbi:hypothetical protein Taro_035004 [Colocasia esculenta]|uniref:Translation initiation factor IF-1, chloroplastic n=1 Tax=Colocasia esculenta TaxID=4460 RepID=A0A843W4H7_COLES|nr:hypothetical protein [Colocasia esculenta]
MPPRPLSLSPACAYHYQAAAANTPHLDQTTPPSLFSCPWSLFDFDPGEKEDMSVVFHPLPTSCAPAAHSHPSSARLPRQSMGLGRLSPLSLSSSSSSSPAIFHHFSLRRICHHPAPPDTKPTLTAASRRLTSAGYPGFPWKVPFFAAQPCRFSSGDDGASVVARYTRLPASFCTLYYGVPGGPTTIWGSRAGVSLSLRQQPFTSRVSGGGRPTSSKKEDKLVTEGLITELLPNCMFRVRLDNGEVILGYVSGKMRTKMVRVMVGDRVRIEVSRYDSTRGRIVYRLRSKSSTD